jgi:site-specific recombinase XerD
MFLRACYAKGLSPRTIEWYEWQLNEYVDYVEMCDLPWGASETIDILFAHLRESGQSKHTVHAYYRTLRRFFNWLEMRRRLTNENPMNVNTDTIVYQNQRLKSVPPRSCENLPRR